MSANDEIRPYGPGKFTNIVDQYVYGVTLQGGCDDEIGSDDTGGGWFGLMRGGRSIFQDHDPELVSLNDAERELIESSAGVIVAETSDGFVYVDYIETDEELDRKWAELRAEFPGEEETNG